MHAAFLLGAVIVVGLIVADWVAFNRTTAAALRYGAALGRHQDTLLVRRDLFDANGVMTLPRGWARLFLEEQAILLVPDRARMGFIFRTAWPLKGAVHCAALGEPAPATLIKRMPWSSAVMTALCFLTVAIGLAAYLIAYGLGSGFSSPGGVFLAVAVCGLGLLVLLFQLVVVASAYRLENSRLMAIYEDFRAALLK
jgi:hypothetical protein